MTVTFFQRSPNIIIRRLSTCTSLPSLRHSTALANLNRQPNPAFPPQVSRISSFHSTVGWNLNPNYPSGPLNTIPPNLSSRTMSDDAYSSFLDKANQDTGASKASTQAQSVSTKVVDTDIPATLKSIEQYYTSEADEPFEPVSLKWSGNNMPSESTYALAFPAKG